MANRQNGSPANGASAAVPTNGASSDYHFPASTRMYLPGTLHPELRVPMREIRLSPTHGHNGGPTEENPPLRVYDTSGPYTDPAITVDVRQGLPRLRDPWIRARGEYDETEPSYRPIGKQPAPPLPTTLRRKVLRGRGQAITQL